MPSKRFAVVDKLLEYSIVRGKLQRNVNHWFNVAEWGRHGEAIEKLKLWDSIHGYTLWDKR